MIQTRTYFIILILLMIHNIGIANEKLSWKGNIQAKTIVVNNQYGDVRLRYGGDKDNLEYVAVLQHLESEGQLYIERNETKNVLYISTGRKDTNQNVKIKDRARIDVTIFVPKNKAINVQTENGKVDAKGLKSNLFIRTDKGNITVRKHSGLLNTTNNTGETIIVLKNVDYNETQKFESVYGKIKITITNKSNLLVKMSTSSNIISDFSLEMIKHTHSEPNKTAIIKHNKASSNVVMYSKRGDLALKEHIEFNQKP